MVKEQQKKMSDQTKFGLAVAGVVVALMLVFISIRNSTPAGSGFVQQQNKSQIQDMITQTQNDTSLSPMARKMTLGSLQRRLAGAPN